MIPLKNLTNAIIYVNTTLFTLLHSYTFQPQRPTSGTVNAMCVQMQISGSQNIFTWKLNCLYYIKYNTKGVYTYNVKSLNMKIKV